MKWTVTKILHRQGEDEAVVTLYAIDALTAEGAIRHVLDAGLLRHQGSLTVCADPTGSHEALEILHALGLKV